MEKQAFDVILICCGVLTADLYLIRGIRVGFKKWKFARKKAFGVIYWSLSVAITFGLFISIFAQTGLGFRAAFLLVFCLLVFTKALFLPFMLADDIRRLIKWYKQKKSTPIPVEENPGTFKAIPRSEFLMKAGLLAGSIPLAGLTYGTISGVYDY